MPQITFDPDPVHAYHFDPDALAAVGFVKVVKVGAQALTADMKLCSPDDPDDRPSSWVGVIEKVTWNGGASDDMTLEVRVSTKNRALLIGANFNQERDTPVEAAFTIWDYDLHAKDYYKAFWSSDAGIKGVLKYDAMRSGGPGLNFTIERPGTRIAGIDDWNVKMTITPFEGVTQPLNFAAQHLQPIVRNWGKPAGTGVGTSTVGGGGGGSSDSSPSEQQAAATSSAVGDLKRDVDDLKRTDEELKTSVAALKTKVDALAPVMSGQRGFMDEIQGLKDKIGALEIQVRAIQRKLNM